MTDYQPKIGDSVTMQGFSATVVNVYPQDQYRPYATVRIQYGTGNRETVAADAVIPRNDHDSECPGGQRCWCEAGQLVPGYSSSPDGIADAADQARWDHAGASRSGS